MREGVVSESGSHYLAAIPEGILVSMIIICLCLGVSYERRCSI